MTSTLLSWDKGFFNDVDLGWVDCLLRDYECRELCDVRALDDKEEWIPCR